MNTFKMHIKGWRRGGKTCPCCVEERDKQKTRRRARRRLKSADRKEGDQEARVPDDLGVKMKM